MKLFRTPLTALMLLGLLVTGEASAQQRRRSDTGYNSRVDTTFAFDKNGSVAVIATNGEVIVTGWPRDQIHVRATSDDDNIRFSGSSTRVTLDVTGNRRGSDTRFEVSVPFGVRVSVTTHTGDLSVRGTRGQVEIHTQNGDVEVDDVATRLDVESFSGDITATRINGDVTVSTTNGDVSLTDVRGVIDVGTISGDIDLHAVTARNVRAKTTNGDVSFEGAIDPTGRYEMTSHSGDIGLRIPRDASAQITISTWSGSVESDFPIILKPGEHGISITKSKRYVFEIGGGGARISADAFSGDVTISSSGRGASPRP
jgi:DUF4097 and DUF4098 domain-containing protein YvlB